MRVKAIGCSIRMTATSISTTNNAPLSCVQFNSTTVFILSSVPFTVFSTRFNDLRDSCTVRHMCNMSVRTIHTVFSIRFNYLRDSCTVRRMSNMLVRTIHTVFSMRFNDSRDSCTVRRMCKLYRNSAQFHCF